MREEISRPLSAKPLGEKPSASEYFRITHHPRIAGTLILARRSTLGCSADAEAPHLALQLPSADVVLALLCRQQVLAIE